MSKVESRSWKSKWSHQDDSEVNVIELISLLYEAANVTTCVTTERMGMLKKRTEKRTEEPFGERGIKRNIRTWRKDFSKIEKIRRQNMAFKQR